MTSAATVANICRHPIKSMGREALQTVTLVTGQTMPWDRTWAVSHELSKTDGTEWARCGNFLRVASSPALAAVTADFDETSETITLHHPDMPSLTVKPDDAPQDIVAWATSLAKEGRAQPTGLVRIPGRGMTDSAFPSVSIANLASHAAVADHLGQDLSIHRWRSNIWLDGLSAWEEHNWLDRTVKIGNATLTIKERAERCLNVQANPETGTRDLDVLAALNHFGHQDFSVLAEVTEGGTINIGDSVVLL